MAITGVTFNGASSAVGSFFRTSWEALYPLVPIAWPNIEFDPDSSDARDNGFARIKFIPGDSVQTSTGGSSTGSRFRQFGVVIISIFAPKNDGAGTAQVRAAEVIDMFTGEPVSGVKFRSAFPDGGTDDEEWYFINVTTPFYYDFYKQLL